MDFILTEEEREKEREKRSGARLASAVYEELRCVFGDLVEDCRVRDGMLTVWGNSGVLASVRLCGDHEHMASEAAARIRSGGVL